MEAGRVQRIDGRKTLMGLAEIIDHMGNDKFGQSIRTYWPNASPVGDFRQDTDDLILDAEIVSSHSTVEHGTFNLMVAAENVRIGLSWKRSRDRNGDPTAYLARIARQRGGIPLELDVWKRVSVDSQFSKESLAILRRILLDAQRIRDLSLAVGFLACFLERQYVLAFPYPHGNHNIVHLALPFLPTYLTTEGNSALGRQFLERQNRCRDHMTQGVQEQILILPAVEPERHFSAIGLQMLRGDFVPRADNAALEKRESRFNGVGVDVAFHVDTVAMPDRLMPSVFPQMRRRATIHPVIVRKKHVHVLADILANVLFEGSRPCIGCVKEPEIAAALTNADYDFLVVEASGFPLMPVLAANIGFIHFDFAGQHRTLGFDHGVPNAVAEIPCGLVAPESKGALNLASRHSLFRLAQQECGKEPFVEGQMRVIEHRASGDGKLVVAILAIEQLLFSFQFHDGHLAAWALWTGRPAETHKQLPALFVGREHRVYVN